MRWTPTTTANGWFPKLSWPWVAYGFRGVWVTNLVTFKERCVSPTGFLSGWFGPTTLEWHEELTPVRSARKQADAPDWIPRTMPDDPGLVAGNWHGASRGHWASNLAAGRRVQMDGRTLPFLPGNGLALDGFTLLVPAANDAGLFLVRNGLAGPLIRPTRTNWNSQTLTEPGWIGYGYWGRAGLITPDGEDLDVTITPEAQEGPPLVRLVDGAPWLWSCVRGTGVAGRPLGSDLCLFVPHPSVALDVALAGDRWAVASNDDKGRLVVQDVALAAARRRLQPLPVQIAPFGRPIWAGYYYAAGRYGDFTPPANCTILALAHFDDGDGHRPADAVSRYLAVVRQTPALFCAAQDLGLLAAEGLLGKVAGVVLGEYGRPVDMAAEAATVRLAMAGLGVRAPIIATVMPDQLFESGWVFPDGIDAWAVEIYLPGPMPDQAAAQAQTVARAMRVLTMTAGRPTVLIAQCYDRLQAWSETALEGIALGCAAATSTSPTVAGIWFFAYARPGGIRSHPNLERITTAIVQQAGQPAIKEPTVPALTITEYQPQSGPAPLRVRAVAEITSGRFDTFTWRVRRAGANDWDTAAVNPASDPDHTFTLAAGRWELSLRGDGPDGSAETGRLRLVTVEPKPTPVVYPVGRIVLSPLRPGQALERGDTLRSQRGRYRVDVQGDGNVVLRSETGRVIWDTKTEGAPGRIRFENQIEDGNLVFYADGVPLWPRDGVPLMRTPGADLTLDDRDGTLSMGDVVIAGPDPDPDPLPQPGPTPNPTVSGANGPIRRYGDRAMGDDDGPKLYVGLSRFAWLWFWKFERDRVLRELDADRAAGYRFGRVLAQVGNPNDPKNFWAGRIVDPDWPDYEECLAGLTHAAAERGHLIAWTVIGKEGPYDQDQAGRLRLVSRVSAVLANVPGGTLYGEGMNEPNVLTTISADELHKLARLAGATAPGIAWATGGVWTDPEWVKDTEYPAATGFTPEAWKRTQGDVGICHLDRDQSRSEMQDRPWRQGWDVGLEGRRWVDQEAVGAGSSVTSENRPTVLRSHRCVNFICRAFGSVLHGKPGVRGDLRWEDEPAYLQAPKAIRFLPGNLPNGTQHNANPKFPRRPFTLEDRFVRAQTGNRAGIVRAYTTEVDGVFYTNAFGPVSPFELLAEQNLRVSCFDQDNGDERWTRDIGAGERVSFDGQATDYLLVSRPL